MPKPRGYLVMASVVMACIVMACMTMAISKVLEAYPNLANMGSVCGAYSVWEVGTSA